MRVKESNFKKLESFLFALRDAGSKYSLDRMRKFAVSLGNPQKKYPVIHVAGTNGKGSVCAMIEAALRGSGLKVGLFTSPHLVKLGERVQINREILGEEAILKEMSLLRKTADTIFDPLDKPNYPSFFEYMTMLAFCVFAKAKVDCAVLEVGLGGLLDSTNIVDPDIAVITSIGYDHTQMLGKTLREIASQKAGIIKRGVPVVCGFLPDEAIRVIEEKARDLSAPIYKASDYFKVDSELPETSLSGVFQRRNAAVAHLVLRVLRGDFFCSTGKDLRSKIFKISDDVILSALKKVDWPARWQKMELPAGKMLILDASHNEEGARALESNLIDFISKSAKRPDIAVGVLGRERAIPLLKVVKKYARRIFLLVPKQPRALDYAGLRECLGKCEIPVENCAVDDIFAPHNISEKLEPGGVLVCTGSIYLAGEVMAAITGSSADQLQDRP